tara:strand:- start:461 stop:1204 length:744 start_codon:yes stop_codon:yes gene_type:complete
MSITILELKQLIRKQIRESANEPDLEDPALFAKMSEETQSAINSTQHGDADMKIILQMAKEAMTLRQGDDLEASSYVRQWMKKLAKPQDLPKIEKWETNSFKTALEDARGKLEKEDPALADRYSFLTHKEDDMRTKEDIAELEKIWAEHPGLEPTGMKWDKKKSTDPLPGPKPWDPNKVDSKAVTKAVKGRKGNPLAGPTQKGPALSEVKKKTITKSQLQKIIKEELLVILTDDEVEEMFGIDISGD